MRSLLGSPWGKYVIALVAVAAALGVSTALEPLVGDGAGELAGYLVVAACIVVLAGAMHSARRHAEGDAQAARRNLHELEREVAEHRETRSRLEAKERDLDVVTDTMSAAVALCSRDLRYLWVNRLYAQWAGNGKSAEQMIGRPMLEILGEEAMARIRPHIDDVLSGRRVEYERFARRPRGRRWIQAILEPTFVDARRSGAATGWVAVIHDIDERKRAAEALRAAQEDLQLITDNMPAALCRTGNDLRYLWMNPLYARWLGRPAKEAVGQPVADIVGPAQMREIAPYIARVLKGEQVRYERLADLPGLGRRWVAGVFSPMLDASGQAAEGWVTILTDIHDRKTAEEALRQADRRKDDFLATLAHELRNPLAPIRNAVTILARKSALDPEISWSREVITRQVDQMSRLVDDLLDIERISRGKFLVRKERIELERAIDMALEMSRPYITAAGHRLSVLMPSERVVVDADPTRLAQVFSNLLNNAAKFTEPQGTISLSASTDGRSVVVSVEDSGIGFPPEAGPRIFNSHHREAAGLARGDVGTGISPAGLGIGLSLVQGIVLLHGGSVEARSAGPGRGAEFLVRLPLASFESRAGVRPTRQDEALVPSSGCRVLVADDNKDAADSLQRILSHLGYEVEVAYDGEAAIALAERFAPRVAILDIGMPRSNGYQVARALRSRYGREVALIALTGWGQEGDRRQAMEAGFDRHLTKPVDPAVLHGLLIEIAGDDGNYTRHDRAAGLGGERPG